MGQVPFPDHVEIRELIALLNRALDDGDRGRWLAAFTTDGVLETSSGARVEGTAELSSFFDTLGHDTFHVTMDPVIELTGDEASHTASYVVYRQINGEPRSVAIGRYRDTLVRMPAGWRLRHRISEAR